MRTEGLKRYVTEIDKVSDAWAETRALCPAHGGRKTTADRLKHTSDIFVHRLQLRRGLERRRSLRGCRRLTGQA